MDLSNFSESDLKDLEDQIKRERKRRIKAQQLENQKILSNIWPNETTVICADHKFYYGKFSFLFSPRFEIGDSVPPYHIEFKQEDDIYHLRIDLNRQIATCCSINKIFMFHTDSNGKMKPDRSNDGDIPKEILEISFIKEMIDYPKRVFDRYLKILKEK